MRAFPRVTVALALVSLWTAGPSEAQDALTKRDRQGPVTVTVTLAAAPDAGVPVRVTVALDTHSVGLDGVAFEQAVAIRTTDGTDIAPTAVEAKGGGHHRQAVLVFPPQAQPGPLKVVVRDVGGVAERSFVWETPPRP